MPRIGVAGHRGRVDGFHPSTVPWVPRLPEIVQGLMEDLEDQGYRPSGLWGQWQRRGICSFTTGGKEGATSANKHQMQQAFAKIWISVHLTPTWCTTVHSVAKPIMSTAEPSVPTPLLCPLHR